MTDGRLPIQMQSPIIASPRRNFSLISRFLKALFLNIVILTLCMILLTPAYGRMRADSDSHAALPMPDFSAAYADSDSNHQQLGDLLRNVGEAIASDTLGSLTLPTDSAHPVPGRDTDRPRLDSTLMARTTIYNPEDTMKKPGKRIVRTKVSGDMEHVVDFSAKDSVRLVASTRHTCMATAKLHTDR